MTQLQKYIGQGRYSELLINSEKSSFFGIPIGHMSREDLIVIIHLMKETEDRKRDQAAQDRNILAGMYQSNTNQL